MKISSPAAACAPAADEQAWLGAMARAWRAFLDYRLRQKAIERLDRLDDRTLADIGFVRGGLGSSLAEDWRERYFRV